MSNGLAVLGGSKMRTKPFPNWPVCSDSAARRLVRASRSGKWGKPHGREVAQFERRFAEMHDCKHAIGVVGGTASLHIAHLVMGIKAEDEVMDDIAHAFGTVRKQPGALGKVQR